MVKLNKIYTRKGDKGRTSLADGTRVTKSDLRVAAFGTVDEANAAIGLVRLHTNGAHDKALAMIQNDLFDLGADLATPGGDREDGSLRILETQVTWLEQEIDLMNKELAPLKSFILPGGTEASARLHLARAVVRRAERIAVELSGKEVINPAALKYLNRLSDYLFVLARTLNEKGKRDVLWRPGGHRAG